MLPSKAPTPLQSSRSIAPLQCPGFISRSSPNPWGFVANLLHVAGDSLNVKPATREEAWTDLNPNPNPDLNPKPNPNPNPKRVRSPDRTC